MKLKTSGDYRKRRHYRVRRKVKGSADRPRMSLYRSSRHLYAQFIDDYSAKTLAMVSTVGKAAPTEGAKSNIDKARALGKAAAEAAKEKGIEQVILGRGGFTYGGRIAAFAEAAREAGLTF